MMPSISVTTCLKVLQQVLSIKYLIIFQEKKIKALINSNSKVITITLVYVTKLGLTIRQTSVKTQIIDSLVLVIYGIVSARFLVQNSLKSI